VSLTGSGLLAVFESKVAAGLARAVAVALLAILPALPYFVFLRRQVSVLWEEFVVTLFQLRIDHPQGLPEPPESSKYHAVWVQAGGKPDDTDNSYLQRFEAEYGHGVLRAQRGYGRALVSREGLAAVATVVLASAVGWWLLLHPLRDSRSSMIRLLESSSDFSYPGFVLLPAVVEASFLGAYLWLLGMVVRRYTTADLRPTTYFSGVIGLTLPVLLASLVGIVFSTIRGQLLVVIALLLGYAVNPSLVLLRRAWTQVLHLFQPSLRSNHPLTDLDGLSVWYETRLIAEGIEDIQNLVTADFVNLLTRTRVPIARLIDWIDQAVLLLHVDSDSLALLRRSGIRTATDLLRVAGTARLPVDELMVTVIGRESALRIVTAWHARDVVEPVSVTLPVSDRQKKNSAT